MFAYKYWIMGRSFATFWDIYSLKENLLHAISKLQCYASCCYIQQTQGSHCASNGLLQEVKNNGNFYLPDVVAAIYERRSFMRGSNYNIWVGKFWCIRWMVDYGSYGMWSHKKIWLYVVWKVRLHTYFNGKGKYIVLMTEDTLWNILTIDKPILIL